MDDEQKLMTQVALGREAKMLLENELLTSVFEGLKSKFFREWAQSHPSAPSDVREQIFYKMHALMDVREQIQLILQNGKTAETFLEAKRKAA
jgi:hypothetical protein